MKRLYIDKSSLKTALDKITEQQTKNRCFENVTVKPYKGRKYDPKTTVVVMIG